MSFISCGRVGAPYIRPAAGCGRGTTIGPSYVRPACGYGVRVLPGCGRSSWTSSFWSPRSSLWSPSSYSYCNSYRPYTSTWYPTTSGVIVDDCDFSTATACAATACGVAALGLGFLSFLGRRW